MSQFQAFCPTCHQANVYPAMPQQGAAATCIACGMQFIPNPGSAQVQQQPLQQQPLQQVAPGGFGNNWADQSAKKPTGNSNKGLVIGVAAGSAGLLILLIVLVVMMQGSSDPDEMSADVTGDSQPASLNQADLNQAVQPKMGYRWPTDQTVECTFSLQTTSDRMLLSIEGATKYQGTNEDPSKMASSELDLEGEGSGTGFVVHPEGIIVTCAHVVEGSTEVLARLGNAEYPAKVIALNKSDDLAILKIDAKALPFSKLSDSSQLQLAEEVRVVGFPLSTTLGESIKVTRGSLAGFIERGNGRILQIDASINPGNSGGPVVNSGGQVVGVASAILVGEKVQKVGFGVPSQKVISMLRDRKISYSSGTKTDVALDGPSLARQVTPSVAFLKVKFGINGVGLGSPKIVKYDGRFRMYQSSVQSPKNRTEVGRGTTNGDYGKLLLDNRGEVLHDASRHNKELPMMLGSLGQVGVEVLPPDDRDEWEDIEITLVPEVKSSSRSLLDMRYSSYSRRRFGQYARPTTQQVVVHPALKRIQYRVLGEMRNVLTIEKKFSLVTISRDDDAPPYLEVEGKGMFLFDKQKGIPQKMDFKGTYRTVKSGVRHELPFTFKYQFGESASSLANSSSGSRTTPRPSRSSSGKTVGKMSPGGVRKVTDTVRPSSGGSRTPQNSGGLNKFDPNK